MTRYSAQPGDRIFVNGYDIGKNISKSLNSKYSQKRLDDAKNPQQRRLKLLQKESFKKQWKQLVI